MNVVVAWLIHQLFNLLPGCKYAIACYEKLFLHPRMAFITG